MIFLLVPTILRAFRWKAGLASIPPIGCAESTVELVGDVLGSVELVGTVDSIVQLVGDVSAEEEAC